MTSRMENFVWTDRCLVVSIKGSVCAQERGEAGFDGAPRDCATTLRNLPHFRLEHSTVVWDGWSTCPNSGPVFRMNPSLSTSRATSLALRTRKQDKTSSHPVRTKNTSVASSEHSVCTQDSFSHTVAGNTERLREAGRSQERHGKSRVSRQRWLHRKLESHKQGTTRLSRRRQQRQGAEVPLPHRRRGPVSKRSGRR